MQMMRLRSVVGDILSILEVERIPNPSLVREIMLGVQIDKDTSSRILEGV